eukprot:COSAG04_NODE_3119_length_3148_cov_1.279764_2_plen_269_part_00
MYDGAVGARLKAEIPSLVCRITCHRTTTQERLTTTQERFSHLRAQELSHVACNGREVRGRDPAVAEFVAEEEHLKLRHVPLADLRRLAHHLRLAKDAEHCVLPPLAQAVPVIRAGLVPQTRAVRLAPNGPALRRLAGCLHQNVLSVDQGQAGQHARFLCCVKVGKISRNAEVAPAFHRRPRSRVAVAVREERHETQMFGRACAAHASPRRAAVVVLHADERSELRVGSPVAQRSGQRRKRAVRPVPDFVKEPRARLDLLSVATIWLPS